MKNTLRIKYMKVPVAEDDAWVEEKLEEKLVDLKRRVDLICEMPHAHEAFSLLQYCASVSRVTHLHRVLPPRLTKRFTKKFDTILRDGLELLLQARLGSQARERSPTCPLVETSQAPIEVYGHAPAISPLNGRRPVHDQRDAH